MYLKCVSFLDIKETTSKAKMSEVDLDHCLSTALKLAREAGKVRCFSTYFVDVLDSGLYVLCIGYLTLIFNILRSIHSSLVSLARSHRPPQSYSVLGATFLHWSHVYSSRLDVRRDVCVLSASIACRKCDSGASGAGEQCEQDAAKGL